MSNKDEQVGMGISSKVAEDASPSLIAKIWKAMEAKAKHPDLYLPVVEVQIEDGDGYIKRSMKYTGEGPLHGSVIKEHIYSNFDGESGELLFVILENGEETDMEIVNALYKNPRRIEYFKRIKSTKERVHFPAPKAAAMGAIDKTFEIANA